MSIDWHALAIAPETSLLDGLKVIDAGGLQIALIVHDGRLVGVVTDGDVRRALVRGLGTDCAISEMMNRHPVFGTISEGPAAWRRKMRDRAIRHLPIVDEDRLLKRLVTEHGLVAPRENWVLLMAGGLGTRLRPITEQIPKPMIEVGGKPILESSIEALAHSGFSQFFLSVNYRADMIEDHFGDGRGLGVRIDYLREGRPLGTAGGLSLLPHPPDLPILVMNGDVLTGLEFGAFVDAHCDVNADMTVGVREHVTHIPYGVLRVEDGCVRSIEEKPEIRSPVSAGIYVLSPSTLALVSSGVRLDMPELVTRAIARGHRVRAQVILEHWIDVGRPDDLERARLAFDAKEVS
jgi:dTDP-glucose pyrophosphorylase